MRYGFVSLLCILLLAFDGYAGRSTSLFCCCLHKKKVDSHEIYDEKNSFQKNNDAAVGQKLAQHGLFLDPGEYGKAIFAEEGGIGDGMQGRVIDRPPPPYNEGKRKPSKANSNFTPSPPYRSPAVERIYQCVSGIVTQTDRIFKESSELNSSKSEWVQKMKPKLIYDYKVAKELIEHIDKKPDLDPNSNEMDEVIVDLEKLQRNLTEVADMPSDRVEKSDMIIALICAYSRP